MAQQFVNSKLKADKVVVFGKSSCPYCHDAVKLLEGLHLKPGHFEYVDLTTRSDMSAIQDYLLEITGARTVPRVFIGEKCIEDWSLVKSSNGLEDSTTSCYCTIFWK
ncbi:glutaredoxinglutaredoxin-1 [Podarcis lilfordi]|uniref:Glutaredoxin-1 n=1 Tax=Podarcis lilfordi TaxID=74358 RepID=A0AA35KZR2_9SAUR|nr:glutaredoxinglutaredoxin-1 [Podarcis lilfordi]